MLVCRVFPIWIVWKSIIPFTRLINALCDCLCVFPKERPKKNHVFCKFVCKNRVVYGCCECVCVWVCVRVLCELSVVWPVCCLLLSVQTICSFSLKPTRSMRVICQVKYCYFLLFHLALLHWGSDCICATSCQHPSGLPTPLQWSLQNDMSYFVSWKWSRGRSGIVITCGAKLSAAVWCGSCENEIFAQCVFAFI